MKKLTLLLCLVSLISASSCSNDDGGSSDSLVGTWKAYQYFEDGVEVELNNCQNEASLAFYSDGTWVSKIYEENFEGECELDWIETGTWENKGNGIYKITYDEDEDYNDLIEFQFEGNTMIIEEEYEDWSYKQVFIKEE